MVDIPRIRRQTVRLKRLFKDRADAFHLPDGEYRLAFRRSPREEYSFENGRVLINGMDILSMIEGPEADIELLVNLTGAVDLYRKEVWSRYGTQHRDFNAKTQSILEKGLHQLGSCYESMAGGIRIQFNAGRLWINDIDPKVVLALFMSNPTEDRRKYLQSLQTKLALILEGKVGNGHSHGILDEARRIFHQIAAAFENTPSTLAAPLLSAAPSLDH